ncbi:MAG: hypothetical protein LBR72_02475, partial [Oscillospiraceae bacterium]|nr:hypothetical protein [Oscillospiraceae bacterium]
TCLIRTANAPDDSQGYRFWGATQSFGPDAETADIVESVRPLLVKTTEPSVLVLSLPHSDASLAALRALSELFSENESRLNPVNPGEAPPL